MGLRPVHHFAVGLAVGYAAARVFARRRPRASHKQVHTVLTHAKFESAEHKEAWKALWKTLAEMVDRDEPRCLSYELCDSTDDPAQAIIYERYATKADLEVVHCATVEAFNQVHGAKLQGLGKIEAAGGHYSESNLGYFDR